MDLFIKANGKLINSTDKEESSMLMETTTKVNGITMSSKGMVLTTIQKVKLMLASGKMMSKKVKELKLG